MQRWLTLAGALCVLEANAQDPVTIEQAVTQAAERYPAVKASLEQVSAAAAGVQLARTAFLPRADFNAQLNRATRNNILGLTLPNSGLPSISGPVLGTNGMTNVWGSAVGLGVTWEPLDFGLRQAGIGVAEAGTSRARAAVARTKFEASAAAADAFLTILAAEQLARSAKASVDRASVLEQYVGALVKAELRPGADLSRSRAEGAMARTQTIQAEQTINVAKAALTQFLGGAASGISVAGAAFHRAPPDALGDGSGHPALAEQTAAMDEVRARERVLDKSYYPRFTTQADLYARGSGARIDGTTGNAAVSGLGPNIQNWALGIAVTFPLMDLPALRVKKEIEASKGRAESARFDQIARDIKANVAKAMATLDGARHVAENTPVALDAARQGEVQAAARYKAGLGTLIEVAEAQRLLTQTEIDDSLARLNIWRALFQLAVAQGDLAPFLAVAK